MFFQFRNSTSFPLYIVFFPFSFEVNLHTYLTTWLSSCLVGIFPRSHLTFAKIQIINKVSPLKWTNLKSTHISIFPLQGRYLFLILLLHPLYLFLIFPLQHLHLPPHLHYQHHWFKLASLSTSDKIQVAKKMTKDSRDNSHCEQSSQQSSQDPTKYQTDLTRRRTWHRPEHQQFFLLVFL